MISGNIHENENLRFLPAALQRAVQFLKENDLAAHEPGKFELDGDKMILQVIDQDTAPREQLRPECHRKYVDVQFLAAGGPERIGWYPDLGDSETDENLLDTPRDICFYKNNAHAREGIIEMQPDGVTEYMGNYDDYLEKKNRPAPQEQTAGKTRTELDKEKRREKQSKQALRQLKARAQEAGHAGASEI